jgi:hypothetical protein
VVFKLSLEPPVLAPHEFYRLPASLLFESAGVANWDQGGSGAVHLGLSS